MILTALRRMNPGMEEENPLWLVVLCDMMTNLMLFFLIMYGFTRQPEEARKSMMQAMQEQFREKPKTAAEDKARKIIQKVQEEDVTEVLKRKQFAQVDVTEQRIRVTLTSPVLFVSGEAALSGEAKREIRDLAPVLASLPNPILIEGHTDNMPIRHTRYSSNWALSVARASSVVDYLTKDCALPAERFVMAGYGEYRPVSPNDSFDGRSRNRRIEINILRKG